MCAESEQSQERMNLHKGGVEDREHGWSQIHSSCQAMVMCKSQGRASGGLMGTPVIAVQGWLSPAEIEKMEWACL